MGGPVLMCLLAVGALRTVEFQDGHEAGGGGRVTLDGAAAPDAKGNANPSWYFGTVDTYTESDEADQAHGDGTNDEDYLEVEDENGDPYCHAFVRMPLLGAFLPEGASVTDARLVLYVRRENSNRGNTYPADTDILNDVGDAGDEYQMDAVRQAWDDTLTWNQVLAWNPADLALIGYQAMHGNTAALHYSDENSDNVHDDATETFNPNDLIRTGTSGMTGIEPMDPGLDITSAVQDWLSGQEENLGVRVSLRDDGTINSKAQISFRPVDWNIVMERGFAPRLSITYDDTGAVSPTVVAVSEDTRVESGNPDSTWGGELRLRLRDESTDEHVYVRFDLAGVADPAGSGKVVRDAYVALAVLRENSSSGARVEVDMVLDSWSEGALTWNLAQNLGTHALFRSISPHIWRSGDLHEADPRWTYYDVTQAARLWLGGPRDGGNEPLGNFGVLIRGDSQVPDTTLDIQHHSKENTSGTGDEFDPHLVIIYRAEAGTPPAAQIDAPDPGSYTAASPYKMLPGSLDLDGSGSTGTNLLHHWTVVDAGGAAQSMVGATASVDLGATGLYDVYLVVSEPDGETDMAQLEAGAVRVLTAAEWPPEPMVINEIDLVGTLTDGPDNNAVLTVFAEVGGTLYASSYVGTGDPRPWSLDVTGLSVATGSQGTIDVKATDASGNTAVLQLVVDMGALQF